jgi:hypothetical protein
MHFFSESLKFVELNPVCSVDTMEKWVDVGTSKQTLTTQDTQHGSHMVK